MKSLILIAVMTILLTLSAAAQGTGFSFQGSLNDGTNPANGQYDMEFRLYSAAAGGAQLGSTVSRPATVLIKGVFSTTLDFGAAVFTNPNSIFLEIAVKPANSANNYTILGPRQQLTVVPFAVRANNATNADFATNASNAQTAVNATNAVNSTNATVAANALSLGGVSASGYAQLNIVNTGDLRTNGALAVTGNAFQPIGANGFVKAMIVVDTLNGNLIARCYNGITNSSTGNCGFAITQPLSGVFRINFGFPITNRFVSVTAEYTNTFGGVSHNSGANYRFFDNTSVEVFTFETGSDDTSARNFHLILY